MTLEDLRAQIPFLSTVAYLDSASVAPPCDRVLAAVSEYSAKYPLNYGVGNFPAAKEVCAQVDEARKKVARFINARSASEIIFTKNTTEAINQVASGGPWEAGDEIILTTLEHQSNMMPWIRLQQQKGVVLKFAQADLEGFVHPETVAALVTEKTKLINVTYVSNIYGSITPVNEIGEIARKAGAYFMIDSAQAGGRIPMDVQASGCDFMAICGRKSIMGPQGTGALYVRSEVVDQLQPLNIGSRAGHVLDKDTITLNKPPYRYEAGVLNTSGVIGFGVATDILTEIGLEKVQQKIADLTQYMIDRLLEIPEVILFGTHDASRLAGVISWNVKNRSCEEVAEQLGGLGVAVASGSQGSLMAIAPLGIKSVIRSSVHGYSTQEDVDALIAALKKVLS